MAISIDKYVDINSASSGAGSGDSVPEGSSDIQLFRDPVSGRYFTPSEYVGTVEKRADGKYYANGAEANVVTYQTSVTGGIVFLADGTVASPIARNFYPKSASDADVRAAATAAVAAGGGTIWFPDAPIQLSAPLPAAKYLRYLGVQPATTLGVIPDNPWTFTGKGTVLKGDGTFPAFAGNTTDIASSTQSADLMNSGLIGFVVEGVGFENFTTAIDCGAKNNLGILFGKLSRLFVRKCSGFGIDLSNCMHTPIEDIWICVDNGDSGHGFRDAADMLSTTLMPGNHTVDRLYVYQGNATGRGIVFESTAGSIFNQIGARRLQCNRFSGSDYSQTATLVSGSTSISMPTTSGLVVGIPVAFSSSIGVFSAGQTYFVLSIVGSVITLGDSPYSSAISATASGTATLRSNGFPNLEVVAANTAGVSNSRFLHLDLEGRSTAQLLMINTSHVECDVAENGGSTDSINNIVCRVAQYGAIRSGHEAVLDAGPGCYTSSFAGTLKTQRQRRIPGLFFEYSQDRTGLSLFEGSGSPDVAAQSLSGGGTLKFNRAIQHQVPTAVAAPVTLDAGRSGVLGITSAGTVTLPTITSASAQSSMIGLEFALTNMSAGTVTVATDGTQTLNGQSGVVSTTIAAGASKRFVALTTSTWAVF